MIQYKWKLAVTCILIVSISMGICAQNRLNFGLQKPQQAVEWPVSRVSFGKPVQKLKNTHREGMEKLSEREFVLSDGWKLIEAHKLTPRAQSVFDSSFPTDDWYAATVPGTVLTTLVDQGIYPDPYWGVNNLAIPDTLCRMDWWYRSVFKIPTEVLAAPRLSLLFNGINYKAEIWLNGHLLGPMHGAFVRGCFDVTKFVKREGENVLAVKIIPPHNPGIPQESNKDSHGGNGGILCLDGPTFICSEGWDWMPGIRDRNIGIWQDVRLLADGGVEIKDPYVMTDLPLPDTSYVDLSVKTWLVNHSLQTQKVRLQVEVADVFTHTEVELKPNEQRALNLTTDILPALRMKHPRLWWPNGYGSQELYQMKLTVCSSASTEVIDVKTVRFGVREFDYELSVHTSDGRLQRINYNPTAACEDGMKVFDNVKRAPTKDQLYTSLLVKKPGQPGISLLEDTASDSFLVLKVNGQRIFCKGGNWGMDDAMKRVSRQRLEPYFQLHKEQHFNMVRNWTGESTEEVFYELCDEYGLLVFNDFWLSTEGYNLNVSDEPLFLNNVRDVVRRYRNHPSLAIWCPRNEGFAPDRLEEGIATIILQEDGSRHYLPSSIKMNTTNSGPWNYHNPKDFYSLAHGFDTEVGSPSIPAASTIRRMMATEDTWPIGDVWYYHDFLMGKWGDTPFMQNYKEAIDTMFGASDNLDDFCNKAQLVNYESYRAIFEGWNSKLWNNTSGVLLWMSHPAWPSMVWQTYSYDYATPGAYYGAKKACKPLHVQLNLETNEVDVVNVSLQAVKNLKLLVSLHSIDGKRLSRHTVTINQVASNSKTNAFVVPIPHDIKGAYFVKLYLSDIKGKPVDDNCYWRSASNQRDFTAFNALPDVRLHVSRFTYRRVGDELRGSVCINNPANTPAIGVKPGLVDAVSGKEILPCFFSDGYLILMPGESKELSFHCSSDNIVGDVSLMIEGYNVSCSNTTK